MTTYTLGGLKAEIADDIARDDLTTQIANAISSAITFYKNERFAFNETRSITFPTVAGQSTYATADSANIPLFLELDGIFLTDTTGNVYPLHYQEPTELQWLLGNGASSGRPISYSYFDQSFIFYPIPDGVYTITPMGHIELAEPAADGTANNGWMLNAYELIRCRAKAYVFAHVMKDAEQAQIMTIAERDALTQLRAKTAKKIGRGSFVRTDF